MSTLQKLTVSSPAFGHGERIPVRYTADGENISPPLEWTAAPPDTQSIAVFMDDPDAPGPASPFAHWLVYDLPESVTNLPEGASGEHVDRLPPGAHQGRNSFRKLGYGGPAPPEGAAHHYHFVVSALDRRLDLPAGATRHDLLDKLEGHVLAQGELVGVYERRFGRSDRRG